MQQESLFFSSCTNKAIYNSIQRSSCLHRLDSEIPSIFNATDLNVQPPSLKEQCVLMTNYSKCWVNTTVRQYILLYILTIKICVRN